MDIVEQVETPFFFVGVEGDQFLMGGSRTLPFGWEWPEGKPGDGDVFQK